MKKKTFALCGLALIAGLSLASCNKNDKPNNDDNKPKEDRSLNIYINYSGKSGISYRGESYYNPVEETTYTQGKLLPTWSAYQDYMGKVTNSNYTFYDASGYTTSTDDDTYTSVSTNNFVADNDKSKNIDLFYNTTKNINAMGSQGKAINLLEHLDVMPNFKAFLEKNPTIKKQLEVDGEIYYTPYFDGYNDVQRMLMMDTSLVDKILASNAQYDTDTKNGGTNPSANVVQSGTYKPYMGEKNYAASSISNGKITVKVSVNSTAQDLVLTETKNIILQQNELLNRTNGCTGKELAEQFVTYLNTAYAGSVGTDKVYKNLAEIFTSESAAYTTDDLIALMRVIKANPKLLTGDANAEIETIFPRGEAHNRVDNIADLLQLWGVQGLDGSKEMLYFSADGKLYDAAANEGTYDALGYLSAIYDEGLILTEFYKNTKTGSGTVYLDRYFKKTVNGAGTGFMMYDFSTAQAAANDAYEGIGTDPAKRVGSYAGTSQQGIRAVLPPLAYWNAKGTEGNYQKVLMRYAESNRALKGNSWCIPSNSTNIEDACKLMDYMYSDEGSIIQDFGPSQYWVTADKTKWDTMSGVKAPTFNDTMKNMLATAGDFWSFMREKVGSTHGIGCVRSSALDATACNYYGRAGLNNLHSAINAGVVDLAQVDKVLGSYTFDTSVPSAGYDSIDKNSAKAYAAITKFWESKKWSDATDGWTSVVVGKYSSFFTAEGKYDFTNTTVIGTDNESQKYTAASIKAQLDSRRKVYVYTMANSIDEKCIPSYAKQN